MTDWAGHLIVTPVLLPLLASAVMLLFDERRHALKRAVSMATIAGLIANAGALVHLTGGQGGGGPLFYAAGNWPAPFGIVLVADRLSAMLLLLTSVLALAALVYSLARWDRAGPRFHPLFLLMVMGVNGAFLTGDLFNLFVFFEVMLAASYGLALHGAGLSRTRAGLHYIVINVATSLLFLVGVSLIYSVTGTLNMADLAARVPRTPAADLMLLEAGASILIVAFLVKAGMWPLNFWLTATYAAAAPPVAALFAILSKVGVYSVLRVTSLLFGDSPGWAAHFEPWIFYGGLATIAYGTLGVLAARRLARFAGFYVIISSGTLLAAIGTANQAVLAGALFYLASSTLAIAALYLLIEPIERGLDLDEAPALAEPVFEDQIAAALREEEENEIGVVIPATIAILGGGFAFASLLLAGLPPLSGFIAKFAIIDGLLREGQAITAESWMFIAAIILSGLAVLMAAARSGIELIWSPSERPTPNLSLVEAGPIALLLAACLFLMLMAGPVMRYVEETAEALGQRELYAAAIIQNSLQGAHP